MIWVKVLSRFCFNLPVLARSCTVPGEKILWRSGRCSALVLVCKFFWDAHRKCWSEDLVRSCLYTIIIWRCFELFSWGSDMRSWWLEMALFPVPNPMRYCSVAIATVARICYIPFHTVWGSLASVFFRFVANTFSERSNKHQSNWLCQPKNLLNVSRKTWNIIISSGFKHV